MLHIKTLRRLHLHIDDFHLGSGECVLMQGASGSGKTQFMRAIADLDVNHSEMSLHGERRAVMPAPKWRRCVMYIASESAWWHKTVVEHFPSSPVNHPELGIKAWIAAKLAALNLPKDCMAYAVRQLSTGEKQRLALLRALSYAPKVLLLDEPTSALDQDNVLAFEVLLQSYCEQGSAILLISHDNAQVQRLNSRVVSLVNNTLQEQVL